MCALGYIGGLTVLAAMGAGSQSRFLLPMLPLTSVITALHITELSMSSSHCMTMMMMMPMVSVLLAYGAMHSVYYGVLMAPLVGDLDVSLWDVLISILSSPLRLPTADADADDEMTMKSIVMYAKHFGMFADTS